MAHTACLVCLASTVSGNSKKGKTVVIVAGKQQKSTNLFLKISMVCINLDQKSKQCWGDNVTLSEHLVQFIRWLGGLPVSLKNCVSLGISMPIRIHTTVFLVT